MPFTRVKSPRPLVPAGADAVTEALGADIASQLEAGHDVAYTALASEQGYAAGRIAGDEDETEGGMIVADDTGVTASQFVATDDGFAVRALEADEEGVTAAGAVVAADDEADETEG